MAATDSGIQPACLHCSGHGLARAVAFKDGQRIITFQCDTCQHEWDVTNPAPSEVWGSVRVTVKPEP